MNTFHDQQRRALKWWKSLSPYQRRKRAAKYKGAQVYVNVIAWREFQRKD